MEIILLSFATLCVGLLFFAVLCAGVTVLILFVRWSVKFLLWRCKLVYDGKAGLWALPFWAVISGFMLYWRIKKKGFDELYQNYSDLSEWIFCQYQDGDYIHLSMAKDLAFAEICRRYFAGNATHTC